MVEKDTVNRTSIIHDSVYQFHDRIIRAVGDTTYIRDSIYLRKLVYMHDSIHVVEVDSIPYKVTVYKQVRYIPRWCKWLAGIGIGCILILLLYLFIRLRRVLIP